MFRRAATHRQPDLAALDLERLLEQRSFERDRVDLGHRIGHALEQHERPGPR